MSYNYPGQNYPGQYPAQGSFGPARTNPLAIASLCCGIGQILLGLLAGIPALILGIIALGQIRTRGERGRGLAIAGIVLSSIGIALFIVVIVVVVANRTT
jgi:Domain of unknown function (DUF4190)